MAGRSIELAASHEGPPRSSRPSAEQIRSQLTKILGSKIFIQSERLRRFLRLTVERTLAGKPDQIKEYALGRDVFDRGRDFDPRVDSIMRVEARRLRRKMHDLLCRGQFDLCTHWPTSGNLSGIKSARTPWSKGSHVALLSSDRSVPAAEIATTTRPWPRHWMECRRIPPPGFHLERDGA
jgi:hypothetical protein